MIIIHHPEDHPKAPAWKSILEELCVPHLMVESANQHPTLKEGKREVPGAEAIDEFLKVYSVLVASWNQDRCDMWFFDEG